MQHTLKSDMQLFHSCGAQHKTIIPLPQSFVRHAFSPHFRLNFPSGKGFNENENISPSIKGNKNVSNFKMFFVLMHSGLLCVAFRLSVCD